jgi:hypothetical protein
MAPQKVPKLGTENRTFQYERGTEEGTLIKIITFQKKSNVEDDTLFALCLLLKEFFV